LFFDSSDDLYLPAQIVKHNTKLFVYKYPFSDPIYHLGLHQIISNRTDLLHTVSVFYSIQNQQTS